ncbi:uncharacterized protein LOC122532947 [Frieseomelitta varia]|uniref:uncharacterized protein LOC122532947 n=1 Tax=Frieseomelitta varia TaxID=561572 RepID=UPI001CB69895|nr:uncharacterized protein LOC122532947 [Frieseomelitta varia]
MTRNVKGKKTAKKRLPRRIVRKFWPTKIAALIVSAIQDLRETKGSTPSKIIGYISYASDMADGKVKRQVKSVLKRGLKYGILRRRGGHYFLPTGDQLDRANRVALRFAKLPLPRKVAPMTDRRRTNKSTVKARRTKRLVPSRPVLISPTVSSTNTIFNVDDQ